MSTPTDTNQNNKSWLHRVLDEKTDLETKVNALNAFLGSKAANDLGAQNKADLKEQLSHMEGYLWVVQRRIRRATSQTNI